jgi:CRISPR-associated protein Cas1
MRVAVVDRKDITLKVERSAVKFDGETLPFSVMDMLVINHRVNLTSRDILKLNEAKVNLLIISHNNKNLSLLQSANTKGGELKLLQYEALSTDRLEIAKYFITKKIETHAEQLAHFDIELSVNPFLEEVEKAESIGSLLGIEGNFSKLYFQHYFTLFPKVFRVTKRTKKPPKEPLNALLSFWYSLYYNIITVQLVSMGFEPAIGYLHTPFRTHNALSSDLIEIFRAEINHVVLRILKNGLLEASDFSRKGGGVYLTFEGRKKVWREFVELVNILNPKLKREIAHLRATIEKESNETL